MCKLVRFFFPQVTFIVVKSSVKYKSSFSWLKLTILKLIRPMHCSLYKLITEKLFIFEFFLWRSYLFVDSLRKKADCSLTNYVPDSDCETDSDATAGSPECSVGEDTQAFDTDPVLKSFKIAPNQVKFICFTWWLSTNNLNLFSSNTFFVLLHCQTILI